MIVSAHRKSKLTEFLLGSTTNYLTHSCKRPVVVLHGPRGEVPLPQSAVLTMHAARAHPRVLRFHLSCMHIAEVLSGRNSFGYHMRAVFFSQVRGSGEHPVHERRVARSM